MLTLNFQENGLSLGSLSLKDPFKKQAKPHYPSIISITHLFANDRKEVEDFIKNVYRNSYGAKIEVHYPILMSVRDTQGTILAAVGFRAASSECLFLEQYLEAPIEDVLKTPRDQIVEIGSLASLGGGASIYLFAALSAYLDNQGYSKAVVTSTKILEKRFKLMGLKPVRHAKANPDLLLSKDENWGSYYDTEPHVISGSIKDGYNRIKRQLVAIYIDSRPRLLPRHHYKVNKR